MEENEQSKELKKNQSSEQKIHQEDENEINEDDSIKSLPLEENKKKH